MEMEKDEMKVDEKPEKLDEKTMDESMNLIGKDDEVGSCSSSNDKSIL